MKKEECRTPFLTPIYTTISHFQVNAEFFQKNHNNHDSENHLFDECKIPIIQWNRHSLQINFLALILPSPSLILLKILIKNSTKTIKIQMKQMLHENKNIELLS